MKFKIAKTGYKYYGLGFPLEGGKFIQKVAEGKSPVWKYFSLSLVVDKESEEYQGHVVCKNCENIFKHVYVYSKYYKTWFNRYWS